jgi:hypothetical protein
MTFECEFAVQPVEGERGFCHDLPDSTAECAERAMLSFAVIAKQTYSADAFCRVVENGVTLLEGEYDARKNEFDYRKVA